MEAIQEKTLQHEPAALTVAEARTPYTDLDEEVKLALHYAGEKKAFDMVALDLREIASFTEFFIICSGANQRQVQAISEQLKKELNSRPVRIEGYRAAEWILMDYGDFIVHIFEKDARDFYDLQRLWRDAKRVELPEEF
jgi:ribosome-associated protein